MNFTAILARMNRLTSANIHHLIDQAEEPERMLGQLVREMDEQIAAACRALAHQTAGKKLLERQHRGHLDAIRAAREAAALALREGDETKARELLDHRLAEEEAAAVVATPLAAAEDAVRRLQDQLRRLRSRRAEVERRRVELTLRQRAARASTLASSTVGTAPGMEGVDSCLTRMEVKVLELEAEAEVLDAVPSPQESGREQARLVHRSARVEEEFRLLRDEIQSADSEQSSNNR